MPDPYHSNITQQLPRKESPQNDPVEAARQLALKLKQAGKNIAAEFTWAKFWGR